MKSGIFSTWNDRKSFMIHLQKALIEKFSDKDYNVFIFGSFIRDDFVPGTSDIDIGIYSEDLDKTLEIKHFIEIFIGDCIEFDILLVDLDFPAFVNVDMLASGVRLTDYFPNDLLSYLVITEKSRREYNAYKEYSMEVYTDYLERKYSNGLG